MNRLVIIIAAGVCLLAIACGGDTSSDGDGSPSATPSPEATETLSTATPRPSPSSTATAAAEDTATSVPATAAPEPTATQPLPPPTEPPPPPTALPTSPPPTEAPRVSQAPRRGGPASLALVAKGLQFAPAAITAYAGSPVTLTLVNEDTLVPHDVSISGIGATTDCAGPCSVSMSFSAPGPGTYPFVCTFHPSMTGTLTVQ